MAVKYFFTRRTNRHTVSRLDSSTLFQNSFGTYGTAQIDNTGLNFPWGVANDPAGNVYVCDNDNKRIAKCFSIKKLGEDEAKRQAIICRIELERLYGYLGD